MAAKFDPVRRRDHWLKFGLRTQATFNPAPMPARALPSYASLTANSLVDAYFVGLAGEVRPTIQKIVRWMETQPEPDRLVFSGAGSNPDAWWSARYEWHQTLGLCKWLSSGDLAEREFKAAVEAEWQYLKQAPPEHAPLLRVDARPLLSERMAAAIAGSMPALGLKFYESARVGRPVGLGAAALTFAHWACRHLAEGGQRDAEFVRRGKDMLAASLLPKFFKEGNKVEPALWLKAIYFDNGVVKTPEQAIARAYDSMPGIERPDFVPY
jgi:hypothetical protein